ncbi:MAG: glycosyltransferase family 87 protein [Planctomycetota bacterium]
MAKARHRLDAVVDSKVVRGAYGVRMVRLKPSAEPIVTSDTSSTEPRAVAPAGRAGRVPAGVWWVAWGLLTVAAVFLLVQRGVVRGAAFSGDFTMIYAGARVWLEGGNPYLLDTLYGSFEAAGGAGERPKDPTWFVALYPPTTYALLGPLGALSWTAARLAWLGLSLVSLGAIGVWVGRWWNAYGSTRAATSHRRAFGRARSWTTPGLLWWVPLGLAYMPVHTTLRFGQLGLVVLAMCVWAIGTPRRGTEDRSQTSEPMFAAALSGLLLAVAGGLKPQLAGLFALGLLATGRWRTFAWCVVWGLGIVGVAVGRWMLPDGTALAAWWTALRENLDAFAGQGFADPRPSNPVAHHMIHLEPWFWRLGDGLGLTGISGFARLAAAAGLAATIAAAVWMAWRLQRLGQISERRTPGPVTLWVAALAATLTLLIAYHRAYDAVLLAVPVAWACLAWSMGRRWSAAAVVVASLLYLVRLPEVATALIRRGQLSAAWQELPGWSAVFLHQGTWALLLIAVALLIAGPASASSVSPSASRPPAAPRNTATPA